MMNVGILVLFAFIGVVFADVSPTSPCCYPDRMSGEVYRKSRKLYTFYINFHEGVIVEDWNGFIGTDFVLYNLQNNIVYKNRTHGKGCTMKPITNPGNYAQCIPDSARFIRSGQNDDGLFTNTFTYSTGGNDVTKTVTRDTCLPTCIQKQGRRGILTLTYKNVVDSMADESVFQKDLSACRMV